MKFITIILFLLSCVITTRMAEASEGGALLKRNSCQLELRVVVEKIQRLQKEWIVDEKSPQNIFVLLKKLIKEHNQIWPVLNSKFGAYQKAKSGRELRLILKRMDKGFPYVISHMDKIAKRDEEFTLSLNTIRTYITALQNDISLISGQCTTTEKANALKLKASLIIVDEKIKRMELFVVKHSQKTDALIQLLTSGVKAQILKKYAEITGRRMRFFQDQISSIRVADKLMGEMASWFADLFMGKGLCDGGLHYYLQYESSYRCLIKKLDKLSVFKDRINKIKNNWVRPRLLSEHRKYEKSLRREYNKLLAGKREKVLGLQQSRVNGYNGISAKCSKLVISYKALPVDFTPTIFKKRETLFKKIVDVCKRGVK